MIFAEGCNAKLHIPQYSVLSELPFVPVGERNFPTQTVRYFGNGTVVKIFRTTGYSYEVVTQDRDEIWWRVVRREHLRELSSLEQLAVEGITDKDDA